MLYVTYRTVEYKSRFFFNKDRRFLQSFNASSIFDSIRFDGKTFALFGLTLVSSKCSCSVASITIIQLCWAEGAWRGRLVYA